MRDGEEPTTEELIELGKLLHWAESNPKAVRASISCLWATAGAGFRELWFNFGLAIREAKKTVEEEVRDG